MDFNSFFVSIKVYRRDKLAPNYNAQIFKILQSVLSVNGIIRDVFSKWTPLRISNTGERDCRAGVGKVVQRKSRFQKAINSSEPQNQFTENNITAIETPGA